MTVRKKYIDIARGIGIILVLVSHSELSKGFVVPLISGFFIPLFFILSGFTYIHNSNYKNEIVKKLTHLIKPYFIFNLIFLILYFRPNRIRSIGNDIFGIVYSRFYLFPIDQHKETNNALFELGNGPLWFLTAMFVSFILFLAIHKLYKSSKKKAIFLSAIYLIIAKLITSLPILLPWSIDTAFLFAIFIFVGYLAANREENYLYPKVTYIVTGILIYLLLVYINGPVNLSIRVYGNSFFICLLTSIIGSYLCIILSHFLEGFELGNLLSKIGCNSIIIFCFHMVFYGIISKLVSFIGLNTAESYIYLTIGLVKVLFSLFICYKLSLIIKKYVPFIL